MPSPPLILAIEPDPHQAAQLASLVRKQFDAELVVAASMKAALERLSSRIPALVLTSALIAPREETALIAWLRTLGLAGAHVQTVTIPVLASEQPSTRKRLGLPFGWDRPAPAAAPDSCDPAVFADWISIYLDLAAGACDDANR
jgi:CheY-like chemotaxis protein